MLPRDTEIIAMVKMNRRRLLLFPSENAVQDGCGGADRLTFFPVMSFSG